MRAKNGKAYKKMKKSIIITDNFQPEFEGGETRPSRGVLQDTRKRKRKIVSLPEVRGVRLYRSPARWQSSPVSPFIISLSSTR